MEEREQKFNLPASGFNEIIKNISSKEKESDKLITFEESMEIAKKLSEKYKTQIEENLYKDIDNWGEPYTDYQKSIEHFLKEVPEDTLKHFQGHGITKKSTLDQLAGALNILANKSIKGWCGPLEGSTQGYNAYRRGFFLIISNFDKPLASFKKDNNENIPETNEIGWLADIGAFVIDTKYYPIVEELKKMFPEVNIIKANELTQYFKKQVSDNFN